MRQRVVEIIRGLEKLKDAGLGFFFHLQQQNYRFREEKSGLLSIEKKIKYAYLFVYLFIFHHENNEPSKIWPWKI